MAGSASVLGPLPGMALPMAPLQMLSSVTPAVALSEEDQEMLGTVRYLLDVITTARTVGAGRRAPDVPAGAACCSEYCLLMCDRWLLS